MPRVVLGEATYQRRQWTLETQSLKGLAMGPLFLEIQRLRRKLRWPRFLFARVPNERKPFLIDTRSPFAMDLLSNLIREIDRLLVEEMRPGPENLWLKDQHGRYTCELRMQANRWREAPVEA